MALSQTLIRAATAQQTGELVLALVTFTHPIAGTRRLVNDTQALTSGGNLFEAYPFSVVLMADKPDDQPVMTLRAANVSRKVLAYARTAAASGTRAKVMIQIVARDEPDIIGAQYTNLDAAEWRYDLENISCKLTFRSYQNEPYPAESFTPGAVPGVF
ncbi:hypothetical protein [Alloyangia pacifica]|uniref:DUF1833 domain-containing protein n=1 Tax=Alloyangia pacifica TaxID=311180 RepID=A0A1I6QK96_9RHOB|nr:hypothetical protein [Alloyangia pacifica]SDF91596.1 hypothetical protein SAMN04488245_101123 [Alloyangia pacifica]SFS52772.1 hypothetical protein SAMN04488050_102124 [Alloyangia pacifica]